MKIEIDVQSFSTINGNLGYVRGVLLGARYNNLPDHLNRAFDKADDATQEVLDILDKVLIDAQQNQQT